MATYAEIRDWIKRQHGVTVKTCWIAHAKELCGLPVRMSPRRLDPRRREHPCPPKKLPLIREAFEHFRMFPRSRRR